MRESDLEAVAAIHSAAFPRQGPSREWIACNLRAYPRMEYFVAESDDRVLGYIQWTEKAGFRADAVMELEQLAVALAARGRGVGTSLIRESLARVAERLAARGARLARVIVTTRTDNAAQHLYRRTLGAEIEAIIAGLYSGDEAIMIARQPPVGGSRS